MNVRALREEDVAHVAALWRYWFHDKVRGPAPHLETWVRRVYLEHPTRDEAVAPLVALDDAGNLLAFLGTTVTPLRLNGHVGRAAGIFPPVIDPERASTSLAGLLLRRFLAGPQDVTFSDGGHPKFERVWTSLGGRVDPLTSLRWVKPLRPAALALPRVTSSPLVRRALEPAARLVDGGVRRVAPGRFTARRVRLDGGRSEVDLPGVRVFEADAAAWNAAATSLRGNAFAAPRYDDAHLAWQFGALSQVEGMHPLHVATVHDARGGTVGAWVASLPKGGAARVFALDAHPRFASSVFHALLAQADEAGSAWVMGRVGAPFRRAMTDAQCLLHGGGSLRMWHARDAAIVDAALLGRVALSRLDGEAWYWWAIANGEVHAQGARA